jgi:hypothetical protein
MHSDDDDVVGQRAAGQAGACTARDKRQAFVGEKSYDCDRFVTGARENR